MLVKNGASIEGCRPEILIAAITIIEPVFIVAGVQCVVTGGTEKYKHSAERSRHYSGDALDFRSRDLTDRNKQVVLNKLSEGLGKHFVVILETDPDHYHIHYAPVYED